MFPTITQAILSYRKVHPGDLGLDVGLDNPDPVGTISWPL